MKNTVITFILFVCVVMTGFAQQESDFLVRLSSDGKGVMIVGYTGASANIRIPSVIQGLPVTDILDLRWRTKFTKVAIPESVTYVSGFLGQDKLTSIVLPKSVTELGAEAFSYCSLLASINLDNVATIGVKALSHTPALKAVKFSFELKEIKDYTFFNSGLETIVIPEGVTRIGRGAFGSCSNLVSVTLPSTLKIIDKNAFTLCKQLVTVIIPDTADVELEYECFYNCPKLSVASQLLLSKRGYTDF